MSETIGQNLPYRTLEAPKSKERLSDEEMGNLLASVGNSEAKAITFILMRNENIYDTGSLHAEVLRAQGNNKGWKLARPVPFRYCAKSLAPIGLVAKETFGSDLLTFGYSITDYGKELGIPLAGLLLDFSERHNVPLNLLFGETHSTSESQTIQTEIGESVDYKKRAPTTTLKILYEVLTSPNPPIRLIGLKDVIGGGLDINLNLIRLSQLGLIQYNTTEVNKPTTSYKLATSIPEGELPIYADRTVLTQSVFEVLKNHPDRYLTVEDVYNLMSKKQKERWKFQKPFNTMSSVLFFLARHRYADIERFSYLNKSEINTTDGQRVVLTELLEIMYSFQNQEKETLERGRKFAEEIISNPKRVSDLLRRAREASSHANQSSFIETQEHIFSIILSNPNGTTNKEIQNLLEKDFEKKLGISEIRGLSSALVKSGVIRVSKEGSLSRFYPNNKE